MPRTKILPVPNRDNLGRFRPLPEPATVAEGSHSTSDLPLYRRLDCWEVDPEAFGASAAALQTASEQLRHAVTPVAFPTETVYGLGADATRSEAVRGIYAAKGRPSDNPLIVHVSDLAMVRGLLEGEGDKDADKDVIPAVYRPLMERFWPGPLTVLLPLPPAASLTERPPSATTPRHRLAPEVTAGLATFGCRMPASALARTLIQLAGVPIAAPSANASTRPSPTQAQHVVDDLDGRIDLVIDGGACAVGVESTVVDGLCDPPVVLRPGGVGLAQLRQVPGWENVQRAYDDDSSGGGGGGGGGGGSSTGPAAEKQAPRAPGMKYKHYSPKARVVLFEEKAKEGTARTRMTAEILAREAAQAAAASGATVVGVVRTEAWPSLGQAREAVAAEERGPSTADDDSASSRPGITYALSTYRLPKADKNAPSASDITVLELDLGRDMASITHGLFSALRDLDGRGADVILIEGVDDDDSGRGSNKNDGGTDSMAAAVMNRLRKAASEVRS